MDGIVNFHKPTGISSAKAVYQVRGLTGQRKSGHAGALDPAASGVLVLCLGMATKLVERVMNQPKVYRAAARLDVTSESFDADRPMVPVAVACPPTVDAISLAFSKFEGTIQQVPPCISAVKVGGVPAYARAARRETLVLAPRAVHVYWLCLRAFEWPVVHFDLCCGRGTYVRGLIRDLGAELGTGGCLIGLSRLQVGPFRLEGAWTLDRIRQSSNPRDWLIPLDLARTLLEPESPIVPHRPSSA